MATRLTNTTNNIPILNQALQDIATLKTQVAALQAPSLLSIYTPNVTAVSGTFTTVQAQGWYQQIGIQVSLLLQVKIVAVGTGTEPVISLPLQASSKMNQTLVGRENGNTGNELQFVIVSGKNYGVVFTYNNGTTVASGNIYNISGTYLIDP
jgi:hypothetical protein